MTRNHTSITTVTVAAIALIAAFPSNSEAACATPPAGLVSWWKGDGNGFDSVGGNTATPHIGVSFSAGKVGQAFQLDNANAYLTVPASSSLNVGTNGGLTVEAWINPANVNGFHPIIEWNDANAGIGVQLWLGQHPSDVGLLFANVVDMAGNHHRLDSAQNTIVPNSLQHVALTYDQASGVGTLYVNGTIVAQANLGSFVPQTGYDLWIGHRPQNCGGGCWTDGSFLSGPLDELSIYKCALTQAEIQAVFNAGSEGKCAPSLTCATPASGLVSSWSGEGNALDGVGGNNGALQGGVIFNPGKVGQAFKFNGSSSYISVPASPSLNIGTGNGITIECWIQPASANTQGPMAEWDSPNTDGLQFWVQPGLQLFANIKDISGSSHFVVSASALLNTNSLQHAALTYDKSSGLAIIYRNGNVVASLNIGSVTPQTAYPLNIGRRFGQPIGLGQTYSGLLDELTIYNRALNAPEIQAIYNAGSYGKCGPPHISIQPQSQLGFWGRPLTLAVAATGTAPLLYQWRKDGLPLIGATNASLYFGSLDFTNAGGYTVVIANSYGSVTSAPPANLTVNPAGVSIALYPGVKIEGVIGLTYGIQLTTDLSNASGWIGVTNLTLNQPVEVWYDSSPATLLNRYYRVVPGPIPIP